MRFMTYIILAAAATVTFAKQPSYSSRDERRLKNTGYHSRKDNPHRVYNKYQGGGGKWRKKTNYTNKQKQRKRYYTTNKKKGYNRKKKRSASTRLEPTGYTSSSEKSADMPIPAPTEVQESYYSVLSESADMSMPTPNPTEMEQATPRIYDPYDPSRPNLPTANLDGDDELSTPPTYPTMDANFSPAGSSGTVSPTSDTSMYDSPTVDNDEELYTQSPSLSHGADYEDRDNNDPTDSPSPPPNGYSVTGVYPSPTGSPTLSYSFPTDDDDVDDDEIGMYFLDDVVDQEESYNDAINFDDVYNEDEQQVVSTSPPPYIGKDSGGYDDVIESTTIPPPDQYLDSTSLPPQSPVQVQRINSSPPELYYVDDDDGDDGDEDDDDEEGMSTTQSPSLARGVDYEERDNDDHTDSPSPSPNGSPVTGIYPSPTGSPSTSSLTSNHTLSYSFPTGDDDVDDDEMGMYFLDDDVVDEEESYNDAINFDDVYNDDEQQVVSASPPPYLGQDSGIYDDVMESTTIPPPDQYLDSTSLPPHSPVQVQRINSAPPELYYANDNDGDEDDDDEEGMSTLGDNYITTNDDDTPTESHINVSPTPSDGVHYYPKIDDKVENDEVITVSPTPIDGLPYFPVGDDGDDDEVDNDILEDFVDDEILDNDAYEEDDYEDDEQQLVSPSRSPSYLGEDSGGYYDDGVPHLPSLPSQSPIQSQRIKSAETVLYDVVGEDDDGYGSATVAPTSSPHPQGTPRPTCNHASFSLGRSSPSPGPDGDQYYLTTAVYRDGDYNYDEDDGGTVNNDDKAGDIGAYDPYGDDTTQYAAVAVNLINKMPIASHIPYSAEDSSAYTTSLHSTVDGRNDYDDINYDVDNYVPNSSTRLSSASTATPTTRVEDSIEVKMLNGAPRINETTEEFTSSKHVACDCININQSNDDPHWKQLRDKKHNAGGRRTLLRGSGNQQETKHTKSRRLYSYEWVQLVGVGEEPHRPCTCDENGEKVEATTADFTSQPPISQELSSSPSSIPSVGPTMHQSRTFRTAAGPPNGTGDQRCGDITDEEREEQIYHILSQVSEGTLLRDVTTHQGRAFQWLVREDPRQLCPDEYEAGSCHFIQRFVLAVFYFSTEGDDWDNCAADPTSGIITDNSPPSQCVERPNSEEWACNAVRWLSPAHECEWCGNTCNDDHCIIGLHQELNNQAGVIPREIASLSHLQSIVLERGSIGGSIPDTIGELEHLTTLDLDYQNITGMLPSGLFRLKQLHELDLNNNQLVGELSEDIGSLKDLHFLQLQGNQFHGIVPSTLGSGGKLALAELYDNDFSGVFPMDVCDNFDFDDPYASLVLDCGGVDCPCCTACVTILNEEEKV